MASEKDRACTACGGSGVSETELPPSDGLCCPAGSECICCPVCLGTGRISDVTPARDAVADAETAVNLSVAAYHEDFRAFLRGDR